MIGTEFTTQGTTFRVTKIDELEGLEVMRQQLADNDKEPRVYFAGKVLKNGKTSEKQGGMFYRFNNGNFIRVLG